MWAATVAERGSLVASNGAACAINAMQDTESNIAKVRLRVPIESKVTFLSEWH